MTLWYFGYGSNMSRGTFLDRRGMRPLATRAGRLDDWALRFDIPVGPGERAVANVEPVPGETMWGVLYELTAEACDHLDRTEGVHRGLYRRVPVQVAADGVERVDAFTYRSSRTAAGRKPSARYLGLLLEGAREHGLPRDWITHLERLPLARDERAGAKQTP